jgi:plasmid replication initiation protein
MLTYFTTSGNSELWLKLRRSVARFGVAVRKWYMVINKITKSYIRSFKGKELRGIAFVLVPPHLSRRVEIRMKNTAHARDKERERERESLVTMSSERAYLL